MRDWWARLTTWIGVGSTSVRSVGVTAGASAPEDLVEALIAAIAARFDARVEEVRVTKEDVVFKLPRVLAE